MNDVLIRAPPSDVAEKWAAKVPDDHECYWRVSGTPRQTEPGRKIWFVSPTLGDIYAHGEITRLSDGRIWFDAAHETHLPCLDDAPTRGFTYIDPLIPRLQDTEWSEKPTGEIVTRDSPVDGESDSNP